MVRASMGDLSGALKDLDAAIATNPDDADVYTLRAVIRAASGNKAGALTDYGHAIAADPLNAHRHLMRAWAYLKAGQPNAALVDINRALVLDRGIASAHATRGRIHEVLGLKPQALADWKYALVLAPGMPDALDALKRLHDVPTAPDAPPANQTCAGLRKTVDDNIALLRDAEKAIFAIYRAYNAGASGRGPGILPHTCTIGRAAQVVIDETAKIVADNRARCDKEKVTLAFDRNRDVGTFVRDAPNNDRCK
jgi:tetratricopeptide (TPR) repeat protein